MRIALLLAFVLSGCAASADGTEMGGVARWNGATPAPAVEAANAHCQKYGRTARPTQIESWSGSVTFSCEKS